MNIPVFDFHCDTAFALLGDDLNQAGNLRKNNLHIDLERARKKLSGYCQCFACFTSPLLEEEYKVSSVTLFEREIVTIQREISKNSRMMHLAYTPDEIESNLQKGVMSGILTIEGPAGFGFDPQLLETLFYAGFRVSTLGWNESNVLTGSHITGEGLTDLGREYVKEAQRLGILIDVSHISDKGFWDIIDITDAPVIATHSNSRKIHNHSRNISDEMFRAICNSDGLTGINQYADFIGTNPTLDTICDHILHFLELDPDGKHIALGGDLDGCERLSEGFTGIESYPDLADRLVARGVTEETVHDIYWNNAVRVMRSAVRNNKK